MTEELEIRAVAAATGPVEYRDEEDTEREAEHLCGRWTITVPTPRKR